MSTPLVPSALDSHSQLFPVLDEVRLQRMRAYGKVRSLGADEILFQPGDVQVPFFVLLSGHIAITQPGLSGERPLVTLGSGQFTGEMTLITGHRYLVRGRVEEKSEALVLDNDGLRALIAQDADISEVLMRAFIRRRLELINRGEGNMVLLGSRHSASTLRLREFLGRNGHPFTYVDLDADTAAQALLDRFQIKLEEIPVVLCAAGLVLRNPTVQKLADCLGFNNQVDPAQIQDVVIIGAGPSGLAAAVYAASEGLNALLIESELPGGQAGASSRIENYLGFPVGISGQELASRALAQAEKFGARMMLAHEVVRLDCAQRPYQVVLDNDTVLLARTVIVSTGAQYNKLSLPNLVAFEGQGVYYGATFMEAQLCVDEEVVVVGGANSAGQAAVFLAETSKRVQMLVRSNRLADAMSRYLIRRIEENPAIEVRYRTEITALEGNGHLERIRWRSGDTGAIETHDLRHLFIMAGASPRTEWLKGCLALDRHGFILTGRDLDNVADGPAWSLHRPPGIFETSLPGVFAVGDVRSGNVKRVASAVGEGSIAVYLVHKSLAEI